MTERSISRTLAVDRAGKTSTSSCCTSRGSRWHSWAQSSFVIVAFFVLVTSPLLYITVRFAPISYWLSAKLNYRSSSFLEVVYTNLFAQPLSFFFPGWSRVLYYPHAKDIFTRCDAPASLRLVFTLRVLSTCPSQGLLVSTQSFKPKRG